jgi:hypothetical protein
VPFAGYVPLGETLSGIIHCRNAAGLPVDADALPVYRIYGPDGIMPNGNGTAAFLDDGNVTGATAASPVQITSAAHGLATGARVVIAGVTGMTGVNGTHQITVTGADTFTLNGSSGSGTYGGGGTWHVAGLYRYTHSIVGGDGYEVRNQYYVSGSATIAGNYVQSSDNFIVV